MGDPNQFKIVVMDAPTAAVLAQILPVLLLSLTVEMRRTERHHEWSLALVGSFFLVFGIIETVLVLSIDGMFYPFQLSDMLSALTILGLLGVLFRLSFVDPPKRNP